MRVRIESGFYNMNIEFLLQRYLENLFLEKEKIESWSKIYENTKMDSFTSERGLLGNLNGQIIPNSQSGIADGFNITGTDNADKLTIQHKLTDAKYPSVETKDGDDLIDLKASGYNIKTESGNDIIDATDISASFSPYSNIDGGEGNSDLMILSGTIRDYRISNPGNSGINAPQTVYLEDKNGKVFTIDNVERFKFGDKEYSLEEVKTSVTNGTGSANAKTHYGTKKSDTILSLGVSGKTYYADDGDDRIGIGASDGPPEPITFEQIPGSTGVRAIYPEDHTKSDNNTVYAENGNDLISVGAAVGTNTIDGGEGEDIVDLGKLNKTTYKYTLTKNNDGSITFTKKDTRPNVSPDINPSFFQTVNLKNIEFIKFGNNEQLTIEEAFKALD